MKKSWQCLLLIICIVSVLACVGIFHSHAPAYAENVDVQVSLNDASLLAAYGDVFAYTNGKTVFLAKNNKLLSFEEKSQFDEFIDIAVNASHILLLARKGEDKFVWAYEYNDMRIAKINYSYSSDSNILKHLVGLYADINGDFFAIDSNKVNAIVIGSTDKSPSYFNSNTGLDNGAYKDVQDFAVTSSTLYCLIDGDLYAIDEQNFYYSDLSKFFKLSGEYIGISEINGDVLLMSAGGIYKYQNDAVSKLLSEGLNGNGRICSAYDEKANLNYVYAKSAVNSVNLYEYVDGKLEYYGCFDDTVYQHPSEYDLVKLYKSLADVTMYSSPRHLQRVNVIPANSYFIALSQHDNFIYVYYENNADDKKIYGYIKAESSVALCPADNGALGEYAGVLHQNTPIYKYPFINNNDKNNIKLTDATVFDQLVVIDNVGQDGDFSWGWYKVGFVDENGVTQYGYVRQQNLAPYTQLTAPSLSKSVKLTNKKLGEYITLYALPFENQEDAIKVAELPEGSSVYLREKFNKKSQWTAVYYKGKTAYVRTENVDASSLTSWQLALAITVPFVVLAIIATVVIITVAKNKKNAYRH